MTSITIPSSTKLGVFRVSPHTSSGNSAIFNGTANSPSTVSVLPKKENEIAANAKLVVSGGIPTKSAPTEPKLSSFGMVRLYSGVEITLENTLLPEEKLSTPPSLQDGLDADTEWNLRYLGSELIQKASILLKLPQVAAATGQILYQRFYYAKSFVRYDFEITAMACINLASKIEEAPRRIRDVMNVFHHMRQLIRNRESGKREKTTPLVLDKEYVRVKNEVIKSERRVLKELGFCVHVKHPHKLIYAYLQALKTLEKDVVQRAWFYCLVSVVVLYEPMDNLVVGSSSRSSNTFSRNYMNDSLRTDTFLRYSPETIACACIFLAARDLSIPLPESPPWWEAFDADRSSIENICRVLIHFYQREKLPWKKLESRWMEAKARLIGKQVMDKATMEAAATPQSRDGGGGRKSPLASSAHGQSSRRESPRPSKYSNREGRSPPRHRRRMAAEKNRSPPRRARSRTRSRSPRSRSRSRDLPKRYSNYRHISRGLPQSYESKGQRKSKKHDSKRQVEHRKRS